MSEENVEIVRRAIEAYGRGDIDTALTYTDPEIVWNPVEEALMRGHDAIRANLERWESEWEDYEAFSEELIDAGDRVVATVHFRGRGRASGLQVDTRLYEVWTLRDGKAVRMDEFVDRAQALKAAGLSE